MQGLHLTADLHGCRCAPHWLTDAGMLADACEAQVRAAGLRVVGRLAHTFPVTAHGPGGVTAALLLAESHLCIHTWPERQGATLDVYVCNFGADHSAAAHTLMETLVALFDPVFAGRHALERGQQPPSTA